MTKSLEKSSIQLEKKEKNPKSGELDQEKPPRAHEKEKKVSRARNLPSCHGKISPGTGKHRVKNDKGKFESVLAYYETEEGFKALDELPLRDIAAKMGVSISVAHKAKRAYYTRHGRPVLEKDFIRQELIKTRDKINFLIRNML